MQIEIAMNVSFHLSDSPGLRKRGKQGFVIFSGWKHKIILNFFYRRSFGKISQSFKIYLSLDQAVQLYGINLTEIIRDMHKDLYKEASYIIYYSKNIQNI